jgi:SAM-dependent methyltransferase
MWPLYVDPHTRQPLVPDGDALHPASGNSYRCIQLFGKRIPVFTGQALGDGGVRSLEMYGKSDSATIYRNFLEWLFKTFEVDEQEFRRSLISLLDPRPGHRILVTGCGLGDDVFTILDLLGRDVLVLASDLSPEMVAGTASYLAERYPGNNVELAVANAGKLPFEDSYFDSSFHFGMRLPDMVLPHIHRCAALQAWSRATYHAIAPGGGLDRGAAVDMRKYHIGKTHAELVKPADLPTERSWVRPVQVVHPN